MRCTLIAFVATGFVSVIHSLPSSFLDEWNDEGTFDPFSYSNLIEDDEESLHPFLYSNLIEDDEGTPDPFLYSNLIEDDEGTPDPFLYSNPIEDSTYDVSLFTTSTQEPIEEAPFDSNSLMLPHGSEQHLNGFPEPDNSYIIATSEGENTSHGETFFM